MVPPPGGCHQHRQGGDAVVRAVAPRRGVDQRRSQGLPPPGGEGGCIKRRSDDTLTKEERSLRESFARLVALQHELKEKCRFTRASVRTFGVGPLGVWLSAATWLQFVDKRLEATYDNMQSELQARLVEYLSDGGGGESGGRGISGGYTNAKHAEDNDVVKGSGYVEVGRTINFEDLSPELQREFQLVQARATEELGPLLGWEFQVSGPISGTPSEAEFRFRFQFQRFRSEIFSQILLLRN